MGEWLPGSFQERLKELREKNGMTQAEVAGLLGMDKGTYGRLEGGEKQTVTCEQLARLSKRYDVTTDFILGLSDVPERTYYDIAELGLSIEAAQNLYEKRADPKVVNELLRNERFLTLTRQMETYLNDACAVAFRTCNALYDFAYELTTEVINAGKVPKDKDVIAFRRNLKACKVPEESYQVLNIQRQFMATVREIKGRVSGEVRDYTEGRFTSEILQEVKERAWNGGEVMKLSYGERKRRVIDTVKAYFPKCPELPEDKVRKVEDAMEVVISEIMDAFKRE
jgi:transcriptional regulator with XRE-family HTH domain